MSERPFLTRRATLGSLAASPLLIATKPVDAALSADVHLLALGRDFDVVAARLDHAIGTEIELDNGLLEKFDRLEAEIANTQAATLEGLCVKARAACWALLGDLDDSGIETTDRRMALSIVRDLIRLYDPGLEKPGALKQLVEDIEGVAGNPTTSESTG